MSRSLQGESSTKVIIGGEEHELLYNEKELEEEFQMIDELEEKKMLIEKCLKEKIKENNTLAKEHDRLIYSLEDETNELMKLKAQLMEERSHYEFKRMQFCKKMMRHHKRSIELQTEDSVESIAMRLHQSDSLPTINCRRLLHLYKQWRIITYNNCERFLRSDQYRNIVLTNISLLRREFKKAKFEILTSHRESCQTYKFLLYKKKMRKDKRIMEKRESQLLQRMRMLKLENERLKKLFQDLYDRIGNVSCDDEMSSDESSEVNYEYEDDHKEAEELMRVVKKNRLEMEELITNQNMNSRDTSITSMTSESTLFDSSCFYKMGYNDSKISIKETSSSESNDSKHCLEPLENEKDILNSRTSSEIQLNRNTTGVNFNSLHDLKVMKKSKKKRNVTFNEGTIFKKYSSNTGDKTIQEEEVLTTIMAPSNYHQTTLVDVHHSEKDGLKNETLNTHPLNIEGENLGKFEQKYCDKTESSVQLYSVNDNTPVKDKSLSNSSSLKEMNASEIMIKVQERITNLEMNLKLQNAMASKSKSVKCPKTTN